MNTPLHPRFKSALRWFLALCLLGTAGAQAQVTDHYHGAALFLMPTAISSEPVGVESLAEYEAVYGKDANGPDASWVAARLFFSNGGQRLYVIDPSGCDSLAFENALAASADLPVDLVAAPAARCTSLPAVHGTLMSSLAEHARDSKHRFALLDAPLDSDTDALTTYAGRFNTWASALYAPWLFVDESLPEQTLLMPPSSAVAGVISRIDHEYGVSRNPAGHIAALSGTMELRAERTFDATEQGELLIHHINPVGPFVNPSQIHIWGARNTLKSPGPDKYIGVSRQVRLIDYSLYQSLAWLENYGAHEVDQSTITQQIEAYLLDYWQRGVLVGTHPNEAWFVALEPDPRALRYQIGLALSVPAEFIFFKVSWNWKDKLFQDRFER